MSTVASRPEFLGKAPSIIFVLFVRRIFAIFLTTRSFQLVIHTAWPGESEAAVQKDKFFSLKNKNEKDVIYAQTLILVNPILVKLFSFLVITS